MIRTREVRNKDILMPSEPEKKEIPKKQDVKFPTRPQQGLFKPIIATAEKGSRQQRKRLFK